MQERIWIDVGGGLGSGESAEGDLLRCMDGCTMNYMYGALHGNGVVDIGCGIFQFGVLASNVWQVCPFILEKHIFY